MATFAHFMMNNAYEVDAKAQEDKLRIAEPLLLHSEEHIELALKEGRDGRDKSYFTTHRILVKDGKGIGKKRKNFRSLPYSSIHGFSVATAGAFDDDTELEVWGSAGCLKLHLAKGQVDLFGVQQFLSQRVLSFYSTEGTPDAVPVKSAGLVGAFTSWITGDASTSDNAKVEQRFKTETPVLLQNEAVQVAFKTGRDFLVLTNCRILRIDVKGIFGKKVKFESILWNTVAAATVATSAGIFDRDMEMTLHTTIEIQDTTDRSKIEMDFRKGNVNIFAVQKIIANQILGPDETPLGNIDVGKAGWSWANLFDREASRPLDPKVMDRNLRSNPPLLQGSEHVEIAFKGIRDMIVFTTKRLIIIDPKGLTGNKVLYTSVPYRSILSFAIESAGAIADLDTEVMLWTDMNPIPGDDKKDPPEPAHPGMAFLELEFNKKLVNITGLKKYLSQRILKAFGNSTADETPLALPNLEPNDSLLANFFSYFTDNQRAIDPKTINAKLHNEAAVLLDDETVVMAFKAGRDLTIFTNFRIMILDTQGLTGKRVSYRSFPYRSIRAFSVQSAGSWDRDSELDLYTGNSWELGKIQMDFRKGQVDILTIHRFLSAMIIGDSEEAASYLDRQGAALQVHSSGGIGAFVNWLCDNSVEEDAAKADAQLHTDPPLLMTKEKVEKIYKSGRDMFVYTSHRLIVIDVQGLLGKKVEYMSIPHTWIHGFEVETAGHMDRDAEVYLKTDIPAKPLIEQEILVKRGDVMELQKHLAEKLLITK